MQASADEGVIRRGWWPTDRAIRQVVRFEQRFGDEAYRLLLHAALPLSITPEFLNVLRVHFLGEANILPVAEADLWLSSLVAPYGQAICRVEPRVRQVLLIEMKQRFGWRHLLDLASFVDGYQRATGRGDGDRSRIGERWVVQAYLDPVRVVREMASALRESLQQEEGRALGMQLLLIDTVEIVLAVLLLDPLERSAPLREDLNELVRGTRELASALYKG